MEDQPDNELFSAVENYVEWRRREGASVRVSWVGPEVDGEGEEPVVVQFGGAKPRRAIFSWLNRAPNASSNHDELRFQ
jgi:hypothetical protein